MLRGKNLGPFKFEFETGEEYNEWRFFLSGGWGDTTPQVITNVANTAPTIDSVTITWDTDEDSDSLIEYGTVSGVYTDEKSNAMMVISHSIALSGLNSDATYYFVVNNTDEAIIRMRVLNTVS